METAYRNNLSKNNTKFKSYYVVWKHMEKIIREGVYSGLNRTMQYGNQVGI